MRRPILGLILSATMVTVYFSSNDTTSPVASTKSPSQPEVKVRSVGTIGSSVLESPVGLEIHPRVRDIELGNVFASNSWEPKVIVAAPVKRETPASPQAPPLPFQFLGRWSDNGKTSYFLQFNDRNLVLSVGDTVDSIYSLDEMSSGTLTFTYLPLKQKQTLVVGEVN